jgi:superfamily II DNA/RNA helicase
MKPEDYTHRIGRTGRAGRSGVAITIAQHSERIKIRAIERFTQQPLLASIIPGLEPQKKPEFSGSGRPGADPQAKDRANRSSAGRSERGFGKNEFGGNQRTTSQKPSFQNDESKPFAKPAFEKNLLHSIVLEMTSTVKVKEVKPVKPSSVKKELTQRNNENPFGEPSRKKFSQSPKAQSSALEEKIERSAFRSRKSR